MVARVGAGVHFQVHRDVEEERVLEGGVASEVQEAGSTGIGDVLVFGVAGPELV
jgi:hypothetical protein